MDLIFIMLFVCLFVCFFNTSYASGDYHTIFIFFMNFRRRESTDVEDLFISHISGMDTLARGLRNVAKLIEVI